jgi:Flp pilus assembly protein TadG
MSLRTREGRAGQGLIEFSIAVPVLLLLLLGITEFGLLLYDQHVITNASREGARYGIVARNPRRSVAEIEAVVSAYCEDHLITFGAGTPVTAVEPAPTSGSAFGDDLSVEVTFHFDFLVLPSFVASLIGGTDLRARTTMKYE